MIHRVGIFCLACCFVLVCGCAHQPGPARSAGRTCPPALASPAPLAAKAQAADETAATEGEASPADQAQEEASDQYEEEPLVSEELPEANPDEVLSSKSAAADRIKERARKIQSDIKEEVSFDIPIVLNDRVAYFLDYFQTVASERFSRWLARSARYLPKMKEIFREQGLPEDLAYLAMIESGFNPRARSRSGAVGPWQFIRATGRRYGLTENWWVDERRDPDKSTYAAASYLTDLYGEFGSWYLAAAAYNCGEGRIRRAIRRYDTEDYWEICDHRAVSRETRDYVPKMIAAILIAKEPGKYGFNDICYQTPPEVETVKIDRSTDLAFIAELCGTDYENLRKLNPELRRNWTPPVKGQPYQLRVPPGSGEQVLAGLANRKVRAVNFAEHRVRPGDTLWDIARAYRLPLQVLMAANGIGNCRHLRVGQTLIIPAGMTPKQARAFASAAEHHGRVHAPSSYTVHRGDSLYVIARRYGTSVAALRNLNPGVGKYLRPGQRLVIVGQPERLAQAERRTRPARMATLVTATYTVRRGDTLWDIASAFRMRLAELRRLNPNLGRVIRPGQKLVVRAHRPVVASQEAAPQRRRGAKTYQVKQGDCLWTIARRYNVDVQDLRAWNGLRKGESIYPGDQLRLAAEGGLGG